MIELVYSPAWFYGKDIIIDICSILVLFLIGFFSLKYFQIKPAKKTYLYLALSFFMISLSFVFKILTNFTIYYNVPVVHQVGMMVYSYDLIRSSDILFFIGSLAHGILMLVGLYLLYSIYNKHTLSMILFNIYLLIMLTVLTHDSYYVFHITSFILLAMITWIYFQNYRKYRSSSTKLLAISFSIILLCHLIFIFITLNQVLYVIAELVQLVGYTMLMITFIKVLKDGKKAKPA
jgi:hypothetical protein